MQSVVKNAQGVATHAVDEARSGVLELGTQIMKFVNSMRISEMRAVDNLLARVGLERRSTIRPFALIGAGVLVGSAAVLFLAPMSGRALRGRLRDTFGKAAVRARELEKEAEDRIGEVIEEGKHLGYEAAHQAEQKIGKIAEKVQDKSEKGQDKSEKAQDKSEPQKEARTPFGLPENAHRQR
jgi:gas vesicle protein